MCEVTKALRNLEAAVYKRSDADANYQVDKVVLEILKASKQPVYTTSVLRQLRVPLYEMKRLVQRRWVNIKRDLDGNFSFEISSLGQKV